MIFVNYFSDNMINIIINIFYKEYIENDIFYFWYEFKFIKNIFIQNLKLDN